MQVSLSEIKDLMATLTIVVEEADYKETVSKELKKLRSQVQMPGFRSGMVPMGIVEKKFKPSVMAETIEKKIDESFETFRKEHRNLLLHPVSNDELTPELDFANQTSFTFVFDVAFSPDFSVKLDKKTKIEQYNITLTDEVLNDVVKNITLQHSTRESAEEYTADDVIRGELKEVNPKGEAHINEHAVINPEDIKNKTQKKLFDKAKKGDKIVFNPSKAFEDEREVKSFVGTDKEECLKSDYELTIQDIIHPVPAKLDETLFKQVLHDEKIKTEADFRAKLKERFDENDAFETEWKFAMDVRKKIVEKVDKIALPEAYLKRYFTSRSKDLSEQDIEKEYPKFLEQIKWQLAIDKACDEYEVKIEKEDLDSFVRKQTLSSYFGYGFYGKMDDAFFNQIIQERLADQKTLEQDFYFVTLFKIAQKVKETITVVEKNVTPKEFNELNK